VYLGGGDQLHLVLVLKSALAQAAGEVYVEPDLGTNQIVCFL